MGLCLNPSSGPLVALWVDVIPVGVAPRRAATE